jgi:3D (Asp-Asp-Asp) domain-containing protein
MSSIILQWGLCIHSKSGIAKDLGSAFWGHRIDIHAAPDLKASELNRFWSKVHVPVALTVLKAIAGHAVDAKIAVVVV